MKPKPFKPPPEKTTSQGHTIACPECQHPLELVNLRDGDQAYWCHGCERGWRAGSLPEEGMQKPEKQVA